MTYGLHRTRQERGSCIQRPSRCQEPSAPQSHPCLTLRHVLLCSSEHEQDCLEYIPGSCLKLLRKACSKDHARNRQCKLPCRRTRRSTLACRAGWEPDSPRQTCWTPATALRPWTTRQTAVSLWSAARQLRYADAAGMAIAPYSHLRGASINPCGRAGGAPARGICEVRERAERESSSGQGRCVPAPMSRCCDAVPQLHLPLQ